jgi:hypothetical protein
MSAVLVLAFALSGLLMVFLVNVHPYCAKEVTQ